MADPGKADGRSDSVAGVFSAFLRLGCTSFGGPVAHLGYFRTEFVERRQWLDEATYADIVALCQFLPGPASSQVGVSLGLRRAGFLGGLAAWAGFTLPSAVLMVLFAYGAARFGTAWHGAWLHGLKIVAVAIVAQAIWGMARNLCPDRARASLAVAATLLALAVPGAFGQIGAILVGAFVGRAFLPAAAVPAPGPAPPVSHRAAVLSLGLFAALLLGLPLLADLSGSHAFDLGARFYRTGSLVFGGGHVVLPLLQASVVGPGWIGDDSFLAGYGAAQAMPGPLFTFAAYLGAAMEPSPNGWLGAGLCLLAIYLPSFLLLIGILPFWDGLRRKAAVQSTLRGVDAAVVGLLMAAFYTPVWTGGIRSSTDFAVGLTAFLLLVFWRVPPWLVVLLGAAGGMILSA